MIHGDNIRDYAVVGVMKLVLITAITKNRPTFAVYFRVTATVTKCTNENVVHNKRNVYIHVKIILTEN